MSVDPKKQGASEDLSVLAADFNEANRSATES